MKTLPLVALAFGCAISAPAQTAPAVASSTAPAAEISSNPAAEAAWKTMNDDMQHVSDSMHARNMAGLTTQVPDAIAKLNDYAAKYPGDVHTGKARLLAVELENLERQLEVPNAPSAETTSKQFSEIAADSSLPQAIRASAGVMAVNRTLETAQHAGTPAAYDDVEKHIEAYQKQFVGAKIGTASGMAILRSEQLTLLKQAGDQTRYDALLARLITDSDPEVVELAKKAQADEKATADLATKPVDLSFTALDGSTVDLAKMRGKVVLIDFWATWCGPCREETPDVVAAYQKYHAQGFEIVGISLDQNKAALTKYIADAKMPWPQYFDGKGWDNAISNRFGIRSIPAMWLVGKDGKLVTQDGRDDLAGQVAKLLGTK
jgi:thiol-disulfide isomerase/thioredoxin